MPPTARHNRHRRWTAGPRPGHWLLAAAQLLCVASASAAAPLPAGGPAVRPAQQAQQAQQTQLALAAPATRPPAVQRSEHLYPLPPVSLMDGSGRARRLDSVIDDGRPVVLTFMYSSCTTVCPVTSHVITEFVRLLGAEAPRVNVVSVSIDPDYDTVARLAAHARQSGLAGGFYTGDPGASQTVQRAFDAWRGDKMNHEPVIFLRGNARSAWVRLDGLVSPQRLITEYRQLNKPA